jgi:hypothetical protein
VLEQWRRVVPRASATGRAWVHSPPKKQAARGDPPFFLSGGDCYDLQSNRKRKKQLL